LYRRSTSRILEQAKEVHADEVALHHTLARENLIAEARNSHFEVVVWTVDDPKWVTRAKRLGIKALISNNPSVLLKQRQAE
jgi:glycerophosphoryl diester phosphodiesterase